MYLVPGVPYEMQLMVNGEPVSVPDGTTKNVVTGTNWEGVGVKPDLPSSPERALDAAHLAALRVLLPRLSDADEAAELRREIERLERATAEAH